jgi:hypothetical protein
MQREVFLLVVRGMQGRAAASGGRLVGVGVADLVVAVAVLAVLVGS